MSEKFVCELCYRWVRDAVQLMGQRDGCEPSFCSIFFLSASRSTQRLTSNPQCHTHRRQPTASITGSCQPHETNSVTHSQYTLEHQHGNSLVCVEVTVLGHILERSLIFWGALRTLPECQPTSADFRTKMTTLFIGLSTSSDFHQKGSTRSSEIRKQL